MCRLPGWQCCLVNSPYVVNRFFETPLLIASAPAIASVAVADLPASMSLRDHPAVQQLAEAGLKLVQRQTQDIGAKAGERYRWIWSAAIAQPGVHDGSGAFWSLLHAASATEIRFTDPRLPMVLMEEPNLRFRQGPDLPAWQHEESEALTRETMLMFPGWLRYTTADAVIRIDFWPLLPAEQP
jgi:hypothetical protein